MPTSERTAIIQQIKDPELRQDVIDFFNDADMRAALAEALASQNRQREVEKMLAAAIAYGSGRAYHHMTNALQGKRQAKFPS